MVTSFKFGRGIINPCKELLEMYNRADVIFTAQQIPRSIRTIRPEGSVNIISGVSSGIHPMMGDIKTTRRI